MKRREFLKRIVQVFGGFMVLPKTLKAAEKAPELTEDMLVDVFNKMPQSRETTSIYLIEWSGKPQEFISQDIIRTEIEHEVFIRAALKKQNFPTNLTDTEKLQRKYERERVERIYG